MKLCGEFAPPGDKSFSHRVALFSLLADGRALVTGYSPGEDCRASLAAVQMLGGVVEHTPRGLVLGGLAGRLRPRAAIDCMNSGTTMRLMMGILAGRPGEYTLDGDGSLRRRPMERVAGPLRAMGGRVETSGGRPPVLVHGGPLAGIDYRLPVASAQLKSALLLAGLQAEGVTRLWEPAPSRDHTERLLAAWGGDLTAEDGGLAVRPSSLMLPRAVTVPGDPSSAAFFLSAAAIFPGSRVVARRTMLNPTRTGFLEVLRRMGAQVDISPEEQEPEPWGSVCVTHGPALTGCEVSAREIPLLVDEVPILALAASQASGRTVFRQVGELRIKETDRVAAVIEELGKLGASIRDQGDDLVVEGPTPLGPPTAPLDSRGDHRMAMTLTLAAMLAGAPPRVAEASCMAVSYPGFESTLGMLVS